MASGLFGNVPLYQVGDDWVQYVERLDFYFEANKSKIKDEETKRAIFLSTGIDGETYSLIKKLLSPAAPDTKTYKELTELVEAHHSPKPSEIIERFKFHTK